MANQWWQNEHPDGPPLRLIDLLSAFAEEQVDYLLVGGQAVALHGVPRFTKGRRDRLLC